MIFENCDNMMFTANLQMSCFPSGVRKIGISEIQWKNVCWRPSWHNNRRRCEGSIPGVRKHQKHWTHQRQSNKQDQGILFCHFWWLWPRRQMCLCVNFNIIVHVSHFMVMIIEIFFLEVDQIFVFLCSKKEVQNLWQRCWSKESWKQKWRWR